MYTAQTASPWISTEFNLAPTTDDEDLNRCHNCKGAGRIDLGDVATHIPPEETEMYNLEKTPLMVRHTQTESRHRSENSVFRRRRSPLNDKQVLYVSIIFNTVRGGFIDLAAFTSQASVPSI
jgi:hypothetical protein